MIPQDRFCYIIITFTLSLTIVTHATQQVTGPADMSLSYLFLKEFLPFGDFKYNIKIFPYHCNINISVFILNSIGNMGLEVYLHSWP